MASSANPTIAFRAPGDMRTRLEASAAAAGRTLTQEIVARLEVSLEARAVPLPIDDMESAVRALLGFHIGRTIDRLTGVIARARAEETDRKAKVAQILKSDAPFAAPLSRFDDKRTRRAEERNRYLQTGATD